VTLLSLRRMTLGFGLALAVAAPAAAQSFRTLPPDSPLLGSVPVDALAPGTLPISLAEAVRRALETNLGVLLADTRVDAASGQRQSDLGALLPHFFGSVTETRRKTNLEAVGFPLRDGFPRVVGPFNVFDARLFVSQTLFNLEGLSAARASARGLDAERLSRQRVRDMVTLVAASAYLELQATEARVTAADAQLVTARALEQQARDLQAGGLVAGIDVLRAEVQVAAAEERRTLASRDLEKERLLFARVIGLPVGQAFVLTDTVPYVPAAPQPLEAALTQAFASRADYLAAQQRVREAEARRDAAMRARLPSARLTADFGAIGLTAGSALSTFSVMGAIDVPLYRGGQGIARQRDTEIAVRARTAEADSLRGQIEYEVRAAQLDLAAADDTLALAVRRRDLAEQQLAQATDRFAAGVTDNLEVVQAQEGVALADEQYIDTLYQFNVAKALLAQALGVTEQAMQAFLGGSTP